jgi:tRNA (guanine-N7-)-methyltransferase
VEASGCFERLPAGEPPRWLEHNPLPVPTEREQHVLAQGLPVYRVLYRRNGAPLPPLARLGATARRCASEDGQPGGRETGSTDNPGDTDRC